MSVPLKQAVEEICGLSGWSCFDDGIQEIYKSDEADLWIMVFSYRPKQHGQIIWLTLYHPDRLVDNSFIIYASEVLKKLSHNGNR